MNKIFSKFFIFIIFVICGFTVYNLGFYHGNLQIPSPPEGLPYGVDISLLWDVWRTVEEKYPGEIDYQEMIYGAAEGMVRGLKDPHTVFFTPEDSKIFKEDIAGSFEGVGMEVGVREDELIVVAPLENTPAKNAGLLPGDKILKIGENFSRDLTLNEAVRLIRGGKGTQVTLSILRKGWDSPQEFVITREIINIPNSRWDLMEGNIARIIIYQFSGNLNTDFTKIAQEIKNSSAKKIILDLRNNSGGLLNEAKNLAGWFIPKGKIVTIEQFSENEKNEYLAIGNEMFLSYPVVVLINPGTASGAEILAAALRDNRNDVKLIGEQSFGKGSVQEPIDLRGGALLKVTVAHWLTPKGELIEGKGLTPDIEIKMTEEDYKEGKDPQLKKAVEILKQY